MPHNKTQAHTPTDAPLHARTHAHAHEILLTHTHTHTRFRTNPTLELAVPSYRSQNYTRLHSGAHVLSSKI